MTAQSVAAVKNSLFKLAASVGTLETLAIEHLADSFVSSVPLRHEYTDNHTLTADDIGQVVEMNIAGPTTKAVTIPAGSWAASSFVWLMQTGAAPFTITAGAGVTLYIEAGKGPQSSGQWAAVRLEQQAANVWVATGGLFSEYAAQTAVAWFDGAGAETGTLETAPTAGDPTKWIPVYDAGEVLWVPAWGPRPAQTAGAEAVAGVGSVTARGRLRLPASATAFAGVGAVTSAATHLAPGVATASGAGTVTAATRTKRAGTATVTGVGTLTATASGGV